MTKKLVTKEEVISQRLCGLKYFDMAVENSSKEKIIEDTIALYKRGGHQQGLGWCFSWSWMELAKSDKFKRSGCIPHSFNMDEALTQGEIQIIIDRLKLPPYIAKSKRKKSP